MPQYKIDFRNAESGMLHSSVELTAPDAETALEWAESDVKEKCGVGSSADGAQSTVSLPRFTVSVNEIQ